MSWDKAYQQLVVSIIQRVDVEQGLQGSSSEDCPHRAV